MRGMLFFYFIFIYSFLWERLRSLRIYMRVLVRASLWLVV